MISFFGVLYRLLVTVPVIFSHWRKGQPQNSSQIQTVGLFHSHAFLKGGSEKVLWSLIEHFQNRGLTTHLYYKPKDELDIHAELQEIKHIFGVNIKVESLKLHPVWIADFNEYSTNQFFQSIGFFLFNLHAIDIFAPDLILDNYAGGFSAYAFRLSNPKARIAKIIHTWHVRKIHEEFSRGKMFEIGPLFSKLSYFVDFVSLNIKNWLDRFGFRQNIVFIFVSKYHREFHIEALEIKGTFWKMYPPVNIDQFYITPKERELKKEKLIISYGQFRPDKMHLKQLLIFKQHVEESPNSDLKFIMVGSTSPFYQGYLEKVIQTIKDYNLESRVTVLLNQSTQQIKSLLSRASLGLHLCNEALGIAVVEMMAAGVLIVGVNSGGLKYDLLGNGTLPVYGKLLNHESIAQYLNEFTANYDNPEYKQKLSEMVQSAQEVALKKFSKLKIETKFDKILDFFNNKKKSTQKILSDINVSNKKIGFNIKNDTGKPNSKKGCINQQFWLLRQTQNY